MSNVTVNGHEKPTPFTTKPPLTPMTPSWLMLVSQVKAQPSALTLVVVVAVTVVLVVVVVGSGRGGGGCSGVVCRGHGSVGGGGGAGRRWARGGVRGEGEGAGATKVGVVGRRRLGGCSVWKGGARRPPARAVRSSRPEYVRENAIFTAYEARHRGAVSTALGAPRAQQGPTQVEVRDEGATQDEGEVTLRCRRPLAGCCSGG